MLRPPPPMPVPARDALQASHALHLRIEAEIARSGGWIDFARYMQLALYEPGLGYYSGGAQKFGRAGDFVTAPLLGPLFAQTLAREVAGLMRGNADSDAPADTSSAAPAMVPVVTRSVAPPVTPPVTPPGTRSQAPDRDAAVWAVAAAAPHTRGIFTTITRFDRRGEPTTVRDFYPHIPGEAVPVTDDNGKVVLMVVVFDGTREKSVMHLLDPDSLATLAEWELPHAVPPGFHGSWMPGAERSL